MAEARDDPLTQMQKKMDELNVMFYTYAGIMQRDAPPIARGPEESRQIEVDEIKRKQLVARAPEYAQDIGTLLLSNLRTLHLTQKKEAASDVLTCVGVFIHMCV